MDSPRQRLAQELLAPLVGAFAGWALGRAWEQGVCRLYFLARDGWRPWRLASFLAEQGGVPVECRYLRGSRFAWRHPLLHLDVDRCVTALFSGSQPAAPSQLLARCGLSPQRRGKVLAESGLPPEKPLSPRRQRAWARQLLGDPAFRQAVGESSRQAMEGFAGYLRQEGLLEPVPWAVVDSGWMGSTQETLLRGVALLGGRSIGKGYYAGLYRAPQAGEWECFFFSPGKDLAVQSLFEPGFFEGVLAPSQGMTLGYRQEDGRFLPQLGRAGAPFQELDQALEEWQRGSFPPPRELVAWAAEERHRLWGRFSQLMAHPTGEQARALGGLPFSPGLLEEGLAPLAPRLTGWELYRQCLLPRLLLGDTARPVPWLPGSAALRGEGETWFPRLDRARRARVLRLAAKEGSFWKNGKSGGNMGLSSNS